MNGVLNATRKEEEHRTSASTNRNMEGAKERNGEKKTSMRKNIKGVEGRKQEDGEEIETNEPYSKGKPSEGSNMPKLEENIRPEENQVSKPTFTLYRIVDGKTKWRRKRALKLKCENVRLSDSPMRPLWAVQGFSNKARETWAKGCLADFDRIPVIGR